MVAFDILNPFFDDIILPEHRSFRDKEIQLANRVIQSIKEKDPTSECIYIPNPMPKQKVKYVFITMEPSFGRWARTYENAMVMLRKGFKNFLWSHDDMVFHYSISNFLSSSYYVTDISKIAMKVNNANEFRNAIYPQWLAHLTEEINLLTETDFKVFFVGKQAEMWTQNCFEKKNIAGTITHFSILAASKRNQIANQYPKEYTCFMADIAPDETSMNAFTKTLLEDSLCNFELISEIYTRISDHESYMSETRKKLAFAYYMAFMNFR